MSLNCSLEARPFQGLVSCLHKRLFANDAQYSNDFIALQLYAGLNIERAEIDLEVAALEQLFLKMSEENWDVAKLERILKKTQLSLENQRNFITYWTNEKEKVHEYVVKKSKWNNILSMLSWRVDMKTASRNVPEINEPVAIFEFGSESGVKGNNNMAVQQAVRFEMNRAQVGEMIATLDSIQKKIDEISY